MGDLGPPTMSPGSHAHGVRADYMGLTDALAPPSANCFSILAACGQVSSARPDPALTLTRLYPGWLSAVTVLIPPGSVRPAFCGCSFFLLNLEAK